MARLEGAWYVVNNCSLVRFCYAMVRKSALVADDPGGHFYGLGTVCSTATFVGEIKYAGDWLINKTSGYI